MVLLSVSPCRCGEGYCGNPSCQDTAAAHVTVMETLTWGRGNVSPSDRPVPQCAGNTAGRHCEAARRTATAQFFVRP